MNAPRVWAKIETTWHELVAHDRERFVVYLRCQTIQDTTMRVMQIHHSSIPGYDRPFAEYCSKCVGVEGRA